jgi:hypothetical protein
MVGGRLDPEAQRITGHFGQRHAAYVHLVFNLLV